MNKNKNLFIIFIFIIIIVLFTSCIQKKSTPTVSNETSASISPDQQLLDEMITSLTNADYDKIKLQYEDFKISFPNSPLSAEVNLLYRAALFNEEALLANEKRLAELEQEKLETKEKFLNCLDELIIEKDDVTGITWYYQSLFKHYVNSNNFSIFIGEINNNLGLYLTASYKGDKFIDFQKVFLSYEGNTIELLSDGTKYSDSKYNEYWEWINAPVTEEVFVFLKEFVKSDESKIRFQGKYTETRNLTIDERNGIIAVINGYNALIYLSE
jgi:hypothetical protein